MWLKFAGQYASDAGGMAVEYVGVLPLAGLAGGMEVREVTAVISALEKENVV